MENAARRNWSPKHMSRWAMLVVVGALVAATIFMLPAATQAQSYSRHALVVCQSASWKGGPGWQYPTIRTLYSGDKIGIRHMTTQNGFYTAEDYGWTGDQYWGFIWYECVGGWDSW